MAKRTEFIRVMIVDTMLQDYSCVLQTTNKGRREELIVKRDVAERAAQMARNNGYSETIVTSTLSVFTQVDRRGKIAYK